MVSCFQAIVEASRLPLSIIIVGVGNADFEAMEELDGDTVRVSCPFSGRPAARDIVQFVPLRNFQAGGGGGGADPQMARLRLAREVLAEVPEQFVSFMKSKRIVPQRRQQQQQQMLPPDPEAVVAGRF